MGARYGRLPLCDAVQMASLTPAKCIGISDQKGRISPGYDADLLLLDNDINVQMVMTNGKIRRSLKEIKK